MRFAFVDARSFPICLTSAKVWWRGIWGEATWGIWVLGSYKSSQTTCTRRSRVSRSVFQSRFVIHFCLWARNVLVAAFTRIFFTMTDVLSINSGVVDSTSASQFWVYILGLSEELVQLLLLRDEQHVEQDAMLVDIEDLTRWCLYDLNERCGEGVGGGGQHF